MSGWGTETIFLAYKTVYLVTGKNEKYLSKFNILVLWLFSLLSVHGVLYMILKNSVKNQKKSLHNNKYLQTIQTKFSINIKRNKKYILENPKKNQEKFRHENFSYVQKYQDENSQLEKKKTFLDKHFFLLVRWINIKTV